MSTSLLVVDPSSDRLDALSDALADALEAPPDALVTRATIPSSLPREARPVNMLVVSLNATDTYPSELVRTIRDRWPWLAIIVTDAPDSASLAVEVMKAGAFTVLGADDSTPAGIAEAVREAHDRSMNDRSQDPLAPPRRPQKMIGTAEAMLPVFDRIGAAARAGMRVLIHGETGTGKTLAARTIHAQSDRPDAPCLAVDGRALSAEAAASLFRMPRSGRTGPPEALFDLSVGTIILDHVDDMDAPVQRRLARALEVLSEHRADHDVRIIGVTGALPLPERFRTDLYYQLAGLPIGLPPLRDRMDDMRPLAEHLLNDQAGEEKTLSDEALRTLMDYDWPGNVRQLRNVIARAVALADGSALQASDIVLPAAPVPPTGRSSETPTPDAVSAEAPSSSDSDDSTERASDPFEGHTLEDVKRSAVKDAYERHEGDVDRAAVDLDIGRSTLYRMLDRYGLK